MPLKAQLLAHARVRIRALGSPVLVLAVASVAGAQVSPVKQDSCVVAGSVDNFGGADNIFVDDATHAEGLVQFDLSSLPVSTTANSVVKASLLLYVNNVSAPGSVSIAEANGFWAEFGVTGTNAPTVGTQIQANVPISVSNVYLVIEVTQAVQDWLNNVIPNNGLVS